jgi:diguanylate cyclase (GGDEF)-like protein
LIEVYKKEIQQGQGGDQERVKGCGGQNAPISKPSYYTAAMCPASLSSWLFEQAAHHHYQFCNVVGKKELYNKLPTPEGRLREVIAMNLQLKDMLANLEKRSPLFWVATGLIFVAIVGFIDFWTGSELAFSLFYLIPILMVTWFAGKIPGIVISAVSAILWSVADALGGPAYSQPLIRYWNTVVRLAIFILVTELLPALKELEREKELARVDPLTGAANRRSFFEVAQRELDRVQRTKHPFSIVYFDLDDFKVVNDRWGHKVGDKCLCVVANQVRRIIRKTDMLARLGGDEFVLLLPEANQVAAQVVISRVQHDLMDEMQRNSWPVTFSIGILTCLQSQMTADELVRKADDLMYSVKKKGKNGIASAVCAD